MEGGLPCSFSKLKEKCLDFGKKSLTRFIYGFNFSFKMLFQAYLGKYLQHFSLRSLSFVCCRWNIFQSALIFINLPCPEKLLVTRLSSSWDLLSPEPCVVSRFAQKISWEHSWLSFTLKISDNLNNWITLNNFKAMLQKLLNFQSGD